MAALLAATSQLAAKLRFVDYESILELNSSVNIGQWSIMVDSRSWSCESLATW